MFNKKKILLHKKILYDVIKGVIRTIGNMKVVTTGRASIDEYLTQSFLFVER